MDACIRKADAISEGFRRASRVERQMERDISQAKLDAFDVRFKAAALLEGAFVRSDLIPCKDEPELDSEVRREFHVSDHSEASQAFPYPITAERFRDYDDDVRSPRIPFNCAPISPEDREKLQRTQDIRTAYWVAHRELEEAQEEFDHRKFTRAHEMNVFRDTEPSAEAVAAFELKQLLDNRTLTRRLIDAEETCAAAKREAILAEVRIQTWYDESGFISGSSDGVGSAQVHHADRLHDPKVQAWVDNLPGPDTGGWEELLSKAQSNEWEVDDVNISDSASAVADGNKRRRIDKWKAMCEGVRSMKPKEPSSAELFCREMGR